MFKIDLLGSYSYSVFTFGFYQRGIGQDCLIPLSQPSVNRCVRKFTWVLYREFLNIWIVFPRKIQDRLSTSNQ